MCPETPNKYYVMLVQHASQYIMLKNDDTNIRAQKKRRDVNKGERVNTRKGTQYFMR